ncbi:MAG TPA: TetR family transcriptional regulator [Acidimicrobiales bacterium]|nr:TetR family transcriptional regulator [Acidimicrobiales bacterium]
MARIPVPPQAADTMTAAQLARRDRVLDAVIELVAAGRVEDLGMKDVADRSGVALGTIYRYFSSKDHMAAAALAAWARSLDGGPLAWPDGATMTERLVAILRRAVRAYQRQPAFARLLIVAANSTDPFASECYREMGEGVYRALGTALDGLGAEDRHRLLEVVGPVWYHALVEWVNDRKTIAQVYDAVENAARLVMAGFEARSSVS